MDPALLRRLHDPDCFPDPHDAVEVRQTHLSVVCLAGEHAYKLKKPVRFSFVDFSTPEARLHYCGEEVRLNRRLCPDIYRGVVPLFRTADGSWSFVESPGAVVVDHAVWMRRLPEDRLLSRLLETGEVAREDVIRLAGIVERFHRDSARDAAVREAGSPENKGAAILGNFAATEALAGEVFPEALYHALEQRVKRDLEPLLERLRRRAGEGRIVDGHGDLHARNIFLVEPPAIFDCIEFRPAFRCGDVAFENAFLVMDLVHRGRPDLADAYLAAYVEHSGDVEQPSLMPALVSYRAMVRAKVASLAATDADVDPATRAEERAEAVRYLQLAAASAVSGYPPLLVLACGLPGSGKSFLLDALARRSGWTCFSSDRIRKELAGVPPTDLLGDEAYTPEANERTYADLFRRAAARLGDAPVLLDANFRTRASRDRARQLAESAGGQAVVLWVRTREPLVRERLTARDIGAETSVSDAGTRVYEQLRDTFEPPAEEEGLRIIEVDGGADREQSLNHVLVALLG